MDLQTLFIMISVIVCSLGFAAAAYYGREYRHHKWLWAMYYIVAGMVCIMVSMGITAMVGRMLGMVGP